MISWLWTGYMGQWVSLVSVPFPSLSIWSRIIAPTFAPPVKSAALHNIQVLETPYKAVFGAEAVLWNPICRSETNFCIRCSSLIRQHAQKEIQCIGDKEIKEWGIAGEFLFIEAHDCQYPTKAMALPEREIAQGWDHCADRMISLCQAPMVGSECITCGIYSHAADKLLLITGRFLKGARTQQCTNTLSCFTGLYFCSSYFLLILWVLLLTYTYGHTPLARCGGITRALTHLFHSFQGFSTSQPYNPFLSVMLQYRFLTAPRITVEKDSCGSDGAGAVGGFHSDTKAMKRLDQPSVQWVPQCVSGLRHSGSICDLLFELRHQKTMFLLYTANHGRV